MIRRALMWLLVTWMIMLIGLVVHISISFGAALVIAFLVYVIHVACLTANDNS